MKMTIDTSKFNAAMRAISAVSGVPLVSVLEAEAAKVLEKAAADTPAASVAKINANRAQSPATAQPDTIYTPKTPGGRSARSKANRVNGKLRYKLSFRYPNELWAAITANREASRKKIVSARGLSKRAWWKLAELAQLVIKVPGYVSKAVPSTGRTYKNEEFRKTVGREKSGLFFSTTHPTLRWIGGRSILRRALAGRVKYFETSLKKGVFQQLRTIAARYPGLRAHLPP